MVEKKTLEDFQHDINDWILKHGDYWPPLSMLSAIMEEVGELAREINYIEGFKPKKSTKKKKTNLDEELADIMFSVICLANYYKVDLTNMLINIIKKYSNRDTNRFV